MSFITLPYPTFVNYTQVIDANQVNANNAAIIAVVNGGIDDSNVASGADIAISKLGLSPGGSAFNKTTAGQPTWASGLTTDTQPQIQLTADLGLRFGPGGVTVPDVLLKRSAANTLQLQKGDGTTAATFDMNAGGITAAASIALKNGNSATITPAALGADRAVLFPDPGGSAKLLCAGASPTTDGVVYFDGSLFQTTSAGTAGYILASAGAGVAPSYLRVTRGTTTFAAAQSKAVTDATVTANTVVVILVKAGTALAEEFSYDVSAGVGFTVYSTNATSSATVGYITIG